MRTKFKSLAWIFLVISVLTLWGCSEEIYENHHHNHNSKNKYEVSFKQFKNETGIKDFKSIKSVHFADENSRTIENEFLTDTTTVLKYTSLNNKVTYSFKIYPIFEALNSKEYYNLVFEKYGNEWNEIIFLNKERDIQQLGESKLESSQMVYNEKLSAVSMSGFCEVITYSIECDGSCAAQGWSQCDGFACPTGQCIHESVSYVYCGGAGESGPVFNEIIAGPSTGGGGEDYSGIYIPNPYDGEADLNNPDFIFATQVAAFTRTLPTNLKNLMTNNFWIYPNIVDFMRNNGGITPDNKAAVTFALTNSIPIFNLSLPNWTLTEINQFRYDTFIFLLQNTNNNSSNFIQHIVANSSDIVNVDYTNKIINNIQKPCQKEIIKNITTISSPFTNLINQTFNSSEKVNVKFYNGNNPGGAPAFTSPILEGTPDNFIVKIRFDNTYLENATDLSIIAITLHELVHAYLIALYIKGELVATNTEYDTLQTAFMNFYNNMVEDTFDQADNEIHNAMKDFISQMGNSIYNYASSKNISVTPEYCENLAWGTMTGTILFQEALTPNQQTICNNIAAYEQDNLPQAKGTSCN